MNDLTSRVSALADRARRSRAPSLESAPEHFEIRRWFGTICVDRSRLTEAIDYFQTAIADGRPYMSACGPLETMLAETPGLEHYYKGILVDAQQIRRWLDELLEVESARKYKWYATDNEARRKYGELKTTDINKFVKADDEVVQLTFAIRMIANVENHLLSLIEGFTTRNINLSRIVEIRKANLQEVWIDPTRGTSNV